MSWRILEGDCVEVMAELDESSVDAVVTDPPYGLEFMGKEWDRLDADLPQENVWKGRRGKGGSNPEAPGGIAAAHGRPTFGGSRGRFRRCTTCGKRQFSGSPCECAEPTWVYETPDGPPSGMVRMQRWHHAWSVEALRVLKPGGHLLAFGGTRTYHRLACALEDAGFEIRDCLAWLYGSGFPKSLDVSKAIDKAAGAEREILGYESRNRNRLDTSSWERSAAPEKRDPRPGGVSPGGSLGAVTAPATPDAERWQGWGTALKPAFEPVVLARKPLAERNVAANVLAHGTGALNVDGTRIEAPGGLTNGGRKVGSSPMPMNRATGKAEDADRVEEHPAGRWPANVILDEEAARLVDEASGERPSGAASATGHRRSASLHDTAAGWGMRHDEDAGRLYGDRGGASRFFKIVRPDAYDQEESCEPASDAVESSSPLGQPVASAPSGAATHPDRLAPGSPEPSTSATPSGSRSSAASGTPPTPSTGSKSSRESPQPSTDPSVDRASGVEQLGLIDTTTTTSSRWTFGGSADPATSGITPSSPAPGGPGSLSGSRLFYTAKTSRAEREVGKHYGSERNDHPTVKPVDLMAWLCRLVTPPAGLVLDPFAGSGSTGIAALREGFSFLGIEREPGYVEIARARIQGDSPLFNLPEEVVAEP